MAKLKVFSEKQYGYDYDALIETECSNCMIRINGFRSTPDPDIQGAYISSFTNHANPNQLSWKWRLRRIWCIIRGKLDPDYEILTASVMDNLITSLRECREVVWGGSDLVQGKHPGEIKTELL